MPIIISKKGKKTVRLEKESFRHEEELQKYIYENPESIPFEDIKENVQFLVVEREFPVSVGSIDVILLDSEGDIYIIETKLYKNQDKRFVLAQVLDYGASLWEMYDDPEDFIHKLDEKVRDKSGESLLEKIEKSLGSSKDILDSIKQNLSSGTFKFIILMDKVPVHLKNLIMYINQNSQFSIYAVELDYYTHEDQKILIPHVFGAESIKKAVSISGRKKWNEESFFKAAEENPEALDAIKKIYDFSKELADEISWGTGSSSGSFNPKFYSTSKRSIFSVWTDGSLTVNFGWLNDNDDTLQWRERFRKELSEIKGLTNKISKSGEYPVISFKTWIPVVDEIILLLKKHLSLK